MDRKVMAARKQRLRAYMASPAFWAACETDHAFWSSPDVGSHEEALLVAAAHNEQRHERRLIAAIFSDSTA